MNRPGGYAAGSFVIKYEAESTEIKNIYVAGFVEDDSKIRDRRRVRRG